MAITTDPLTATYGPLQVVVLRCFVPRNGHTWRLAFGHAE